jgi:hypothetical protein
MCSVSVAQRLLRKPTAQAVTADLRWRGRCLHLEKKGWELLRWAIPSRQSDSPSSGHLPTPSAYPNMRVIQEDPSHG